jgi:putative flippase GtrA
VSRPRGTAASATPRQRIVAVIVWIRRPELGILGQGIRYGIAGATVALVSLGGTIALAQGFGLPFEAAFAIGYTLALITHFTLQRFFVWSHHEEFALPVHQQLVRYLPVALSNYGIVALAIAVLPRALGISSLVVYVVTLLLVTLLSFLILRSRVFHAEDGSEDAG